MANIIHDPYWWEDAPLARHDQTALGSKVDVAVIGAGYAGLSVALHLARAGRSVQVFDRDRPGEGASSRNGGITSGNVRPSQASLVKSFGAARAAAITAEGLAARRWFYDFLRNEDMDAGFSLTGRFCGALSAADYEAQARGAEALAREHKIDAFVVPKSEVGTYINTDFYHGGVVRGDIGGVQPAKLHAGLLKLAVQAGVVVQGCCRVEKIGVDADGYLVTTERGSCKAREVVVCTNGYTDHFDRWLRQRVVPVRSRIIATEPLGRRKIQNLVPPLMMLTDSRELSYYFRPSPDGERILFGGRDGTIAGDSEASTRHLVTELERIFPDLVGCGISHSWFGYVAMNRDMVPRVFGHKGRRYATSFCGSGVVWAPWVGYKLALQMLGEQEAQTAFDFRPPGLVPTIRGKAWFMPLVFAWKARQDAKLSSIKP